MANLYRVNGKLPKFTDLGCYPIYYLGTAEQRREIIKKFPWEGK